MPFPPDPRQAAHVIAGFRYQILHSILALLDLGGEETLLLEISEDYTVTSATTETDYQVKGSQAAAGPPSYSLQSRDVRDAIVRFWEAAQAQPVRRLVFLARGGVARERDLEFPGNVAGLGYWSVAAIDGDTTPMRTALSKILHGSPIADWLDTLPSDVEFRSRLLRRIDWQLNAKPSDDLLRDTLDRVRSMYSSANLPVVAAEQAVNGLIALVFEAASHPNPAYRKLTRQNLDDTIQSSAGAALVAARMAGVPDNIGNELFLSEVSSFERSARRDELVDSLVEQSVGRSVLWLQGAHEVGKSYLARLVALKLGGKWLALDLWPLKDNPAAALAAWRTAAQSAARAGVQGLIIDDLVGAAASSLAGRVVALEAELRSRGARMIVTSHQPPSASHTIEFGEKMVVVPAPYFSEEDIRELVELPDPPQPDMVLPWAKLIKLTTSGHPLLAAARAAGLRARGWPKEAIREDVTTVSEATQLTRDEARRELLNNLGELGESRSLSASQLLRRIAAVYDRVDDGVIGRLLAADPAVVNGRDVLAVLKGSWLEALPNGDMRVSPLLKDIASDVSEKDLKLWRRIAAEHWLSQGTLDERTLPLCFWNAFFGEHDWVLIKISELMQTMGREKLKSAAAILSPLTVLSVDNHIYSGEPVAAVFVRVLQFVVADALDDADAAAGAGRRLQIELDALGSMARSVISVTTAMQVLMAESPLPAKVHIDFALRLREAMPVFIGLSDGESVIGPAALPPALLASGKDISDFFFTRLVEKIKSTEQEIEMIEALDGIEALSRDRFLEAAAIVFDDLSVVLHSGWAADQVGGRDMEKALSGYGRIQAIVERWDRPDIVTLIVISRSVILDENLEKQAEALQLIDDRLQQIGPSFPLLRRRARLLDRMGRTSEALSLYRLIEAEIRDLSPFDRCLTYRDSAISAAKSGEFPDASRLIDLACQAAEQCDGHEGLRVGLLVDKAFSLWMAGDREGAVSQAGNVLRKLVTIDFRGNRQEERSHQYARALVGFFFENAVGLPKKAPFSIGDASHLELAAAELTGVAMKPLGDIWRILAVVEARLGMSIGIDAESMSRRDGPLTVSIEQMLIQSKYWTSLAGDDLIECFSLAAEVIATSRLRDMAQAPPEAFAVSLPFALGVAEVEGAEMLFLDIMASRWAFGKCPTVGMAAEIDAACTAVFGSALALALQAMSAVFQVGAESSRVEMFSHGMSTPPSEVLRDPGMRMIRDMYLLAHMSHTISRECLAEGASKLVIDGWRDVVRNQAFLLQMPMKSVPPIEDALRNAEGLAGAARVLISARGAVRHGFGDGWFAMLERLSASA